MALTKVHDRMIAGSLVNVKDYGATGDGTTNDTVAVQAAIDASASGGTVYFPTGIYRIARTAGTDDRWGIKVTNNNVTLKGDHATLRRYDTDISTYALAYPILFVGVPDSNSANVTENIIIEDLTFQGEDTLHSISGGAPLDYRSAIMFKNTNETTVDRCTFNNIDSSAIYYQKPAMYNYVNSAYFNTTKNYNGLITNSSFFATSHAVAGRALIHAIGVGGIDHLTADSNYFEWCDDAFQGSGTYEWINQTEDTTWTPIYAGWALGAVKRTGRDWVFSNNIVINSSEHAVYASGSNINVTGNICRAENSTICQGDIKVRSVGGIISGNSVVSGVNGVCISVQEYSTNITVTGNTCYADSTNIQGGVISLESNGVSAYIDAREYFSAYYKMENITISGNSIYLPSSSSSALNHIGIRIYSDTADTNYPEGQIRNININGNNINNHRHGVYCVGLLHRNVIIENNVFDGKPFISSGFSGGTVTNTESALVVNSGSTSALTNVQFRGNKVNGSSYLFTTNDASGTLVHIPYGITANSLSYIKNFKSSDMRSPSSFNMFQNNSGVHFLDRTTWVGGWSLNNSLDSGATSDGDKKYSFFYNGTNILFYTDDSATAITL
tara:strand:+ start:2557 stop:4395 length:1839 start_codon:yes stop_codon:yes gene_type:complete